MTGVAGLPKLNGGVGRSQSNGVTGREVLVGEAMNEQNRSARGCDGMQGRRLREVDVVTEAGEEKSPFDRGTKKSSTQPWARAKLLAHAVVSGFAKGGVGRLSNDGAVVGDGKRLEKLRGAHGVADAVDAPGRVVLLQPKEPAA